jgi:uncharacterized repeat protein (TIGR01451 family)
VTLGSDATASRLVLARSHPAIAIVNSPKLQTLETKVVAMIDAKTHTRKPALVFGTARFTITVMNTNPVELTGVTVTDPLSPGCNRNIGTLAPGASIAYFCSAANVGRSYTNRVTVSGQWPKGTRMLADAQATATARAMVKVKPKTKTVHAPHVAFTG